MPLTKPRELSVLARPIVLVSSLRGRRYEVAETALANRYRSAGDPCQIETGGGACGSSDTVPYVFDDGQRVLVCGWHREGAGLR